MTKKPKSTAAEIAEEKMPGWKAVAPSGPISPLGETRRYPADAVRDSVPADAVMPSTRQLRAKFLGADAAAQEADNSNADPLEADVELVDMKSGGIERTVGVNSKTKKIDWSQG
jgi:hypothetical protein